MAIQRTQDQERAGQAYKDVSSIVKLGYAKDYKSLAKSAPADIQTNGLGQTVAFWRAKAKGKKDNEYDSLYQHVSAWIKTKLGHTADLQSWIIDPATSSDQYRRATVEALAYLGWIKRFADAEIKE